MPILESPMAGKIVQISVKPGDKVQDGDELLVLESMKMEIPVMAEEEGTVTEVLCEVGKDIMAGAVLIKY